MGRESRCTACGKGPFENISIHMSRCRPVAHFGEGGYERRIAEARRRKARKRALLRAQQEQARRKREAQEREEAARQARLQVSYMFSAYPYRLL